MGHIYVVMARSISSPSQLDLLGIFDTEVRAQTFIDLAPTPQRERLEIHRRELNSATNDPFWTGDAAANVSEFRRRLNTQLDEQREQLRRLDDSTLAALLEHIRSLYPDPHFDFVRFLCSWILSPVPTLGGVTPAETLALGDGLSRVKEVLGRQAAGVSP